jgi:hypothetical protein
MMTFDQVVFCCHGNQILPLLESPTDAERSVLGNFTTSRNEVCLHTDSTVLPTRANARASWNYSLSADPSAPATMTYHMNRLQSLPVAEDYCVTLNESGRIDSRRGGARSAGRTALTFAARTGSMDFTRTASTPRCEWRAPLAWSVERHGIGHVFRNGAAPQV